MNKKFLCNALACLMALSTVFSVTACKNKPEDETNNGGGGETNNGGNGETNNGGNGGGTNNGGNGNNVGQVIEPGTVITDETIKGDIFNSLSQSELGGFTYSATANISVKAGEAAQTQKLVAEGSVLLSDAISADVYAYVEGGSGEDAVNQYLLLFVREGYAYTAQGDWSEEGAVDFAALKEQLKAKEDPLVLGREKLSGTISAMLKQPAVVKIIKNLPTLSEGTITKTEGGFSLDFGLMAAVESILDGIGSLAKVIDKNMEITLGGLFAQEYLKTTLEKLLKGITAEELRAAAVAFLPEEIGKELPAAAKDASAVSYAEGLLRSGSFYTAFTGGEDKWEEFQTFAEVPFKSVLDIISGGEFSMGDKTFTKLIEEFKEDLESQAVSLLLGLIELNDGELADTDFDVTISFSFGDDKKLLGFSLEGNVEGSRTNLPDESDPEDEEQTPDEGESEGESEDDSENDSENENGSETDEPDEETAAKKASEEEEQKTTVRGTVKLQATCASAPELFDLAGCKYYNSDGDKVTIPEAK